MNTTKLTGEHIKNMNVYLKVEFEIDGVKYEGWMDGYIDSDTCRPVKK